MKEVIGNHDGITMFLLEPENEVISVHSKFCSYDDVVCKPSNAPNCQKLTDTFAGLRIDEDVIDEYYKLVSRCPQLQPEDVIVPKRSLSRGLDNS